MFINVVRKTICPPGYYQSVNSSMATNALGHMNKTVHHVEKCLSYHEVVYIYCNYINIYIHIYLYIVSAIYIH